MDRTGFTLSTGTFTGTREMDKHPLVELSSYKLHMHIQYVYIGAAGGAAEVWWEAIQNVVVMIQ